jgi:hypothetical protein
MADGVPVALQLLGNLLVIGLVGGGSTKDEPTAKDQRLRRGPRPDQGLELLANFGGKDNT